jgi:hypothetical protein
MPEEISCSIDDRSVTSLSLGCTNSGADAMSLYQHKCTELRINIRPSVLLIHCVTKFASKSPNESLRGLVVESVRSRRTA